MIFDVSGKKPITEGGEGYIYDNNNYVIKIYKSHIDLDSKRKRIDILMQTNLPKEVIKPVDIITDRKNQFIGMKMPKVKGEDFKKLSNKKYVVTNHINTKDILQMLGRFWDILKILHSHSIIIGDLNDQNILFDVKTKEIYLIDVDSWTIGTEKCLVAMDLFKDPKLISNNFNAETDIYSFCVLAWKTLTRIHPYGGTTNPDMSIIDRINKRISVIDNPKVKIPKTTKSWVNLSPNMTQGFKNVFEKDDRKFGEFINDMLANLSYCKKDHDYYYNKYSSCPICDASAAIIKKAISIGVENGFKLAKILNDLDVKTVYSDTTYLNQNNEIVDLKSGKKIPYTEGRYLFDDNGHLITVYKDYFEVDINNNKSIIPIQFNSYPIIDNNKIYYISNQGQLCSAEILHNGTIGTISISKCSARAEFNIVDQHYCIVNIFNGKLVINIDGYNNDFDFNYKIVEIAEHYDPSLNRWLIVIEDTRSNYYSYVFENNNQLWENNNISYKCSVYNICFDHGAIYIPKDGAIRGMNYQSLNYKDFTCNIVDASSNLIKKSNQFIIVNDENIYRFYK